MPQDQSAWIYHQWLLELTDNEEIKKQDLETCNEILNMEIDENEKKCNFQFSFQ